MCFCLPISRLRQNALSDFHVFVCKYIIYRSKIYSYSVFYFKFKPKKYNSSPTVSLNVSCFSRPVCGLTVNQIEKLLRTLRLEKLVFYNIIFYKFPDSLSVSSKMAANFNFAKNLGSPSMFLYCYYALQVYSLGIFKTSYNFIDFGII